MSLRLRHLLCSVLPLALACAAPAADDAQSGEQADTAWLSDTSYELGASFRSTVIAEATGELADVATSEDAQIAAVDAQWKYAKRQIEAKGYHLNQLADTLRITDKRVDGRKVTLTYEAKVDLIKELRTGAEPPALADLPEKTIALKLPSEPAGAYGRAEGKCHEAVHGDTPSADYNFYYYFTPKAECPLAMTETTLTIDQVYERKAVYPEYDRLLDGLGRGRRGFRAALVPATGDYDPMSRFDAHKRMLERDLGLTGASVDDGKILRFSLERDGTTIEIDLLDPTKHDLSPSFRAALREYQLVFYNGHSRYGTRDFLTDEGAFSDKYQIIMMHSCRSYPYYVRQVFRAKATAQDPKGWDAADVVATGESSYPTDSPRTLQPLLEGLSAGIAAANARRGQGAPSWLSIVKKMNDKTHGIMYGVAGVRENRYKPAR